MTTEIYMQSGNRTVTTNNRHALILKGKSVPTRTVYHTRRDCSTGECSIYQKEQHAHVNVNMSI